MGSLDSIAGAVVLSEDKELRGFHPVERVEVLAKLARRRKDQAEVGGIQTSSVVL